MKSARTGSRLLLLLLGLALSLISNVASAASGSPDPTFGNDGEVVTLMGTGGRAYAAALQPDGRIIAAGDADNPTQGHFALARYLADGSLDPSFGSGGKVLTDVGPVLHDAARAVSYVPRDNTILAAGSAGTGAAQLDAAVVRYNLDGSLDSTFGTGGKAITQTSTSFDQVQDLVLVPAGLISDAYVVAAVEAVNTSTSEREIVLLRYNLIVSPGTLDSSFGSGGVVHTTLPGGPTFATGIARQSDGKLVVVGRFAGASAVGGADVAVLRYNADGSLDATFGSGGVVVTDVAGLDFPEDVAVQADGRIVVAGTTSTGTAMFALRYQTDGTVDASFGIAGSALVSFGPESRAYAVAQQADGKLVLAGAATTSDGGFALARLTVAGELDATFGSGGRVHMPIDVASGPSSDVGQDLLIQRDGRLVVVGHSALGSDLRFAVTRTLGDCGDADLDAGEQCDDGNFVDGDGCDADCTLSASMERISVGPAAVQGNADSRLPSLSADGRWVAFSTFATNLDGLGEAGVFVYDRNGGVLERVTVDSNEIPDGGSSVATAISPDGRFVAFYSDASQLVAGDTNGRLDGFVRDRLLGITERISVDATGNEIFPTLGSAGPIAITPDGRFVLFCTDAGIVDAGGRFELYLRDRDLGITERIGVDTAGGPPSNSTCVPVYPPSAPVGISDDGRWVLFSSSATDLVAGDTNGVADVFLRDRQMGTTERVSLASGGGQLTGTSSSAALSPDGRYVLFTSLASDVVAGDTNGARDVFLIDRQLDTVERVSLSWLGEQANGSSADWASMSADARYILFSSSASNLVVNDPQRTDLFLRDRQTSTTVKVTSAAGKTLANADSTERAAISPNGNVVGFSSGASNLVAGDTNGVADVFVRAFRCGNGVVEANEDCDDGNQVDGDGCEYTCHFTPEEISTAASAGGTVSTDTENDDATADDPLETSVTTPNAGTVIITEGDVGAVPAGYTILGQRAHIDAPSATTAAPLVLVFRIDASVLPPPGTSVLVLRDGQPLPDCSGNAGEASPDPCIAARVSEGDGDLTLTALTSHASDWAIVSLPNCGNGTPDAGEQCDLGTANGDDCCDANCLLVDDFDGDGICRRDDSCPYVAAVAPASMSARKALLIYKSNGPGGGDDVPKLIQARFQAAPSFDPQTTHSMHIRFRNGTNGQTLFTADLAPGSLWSRRPGKRIWKYRDMARPASAGVAVVVLKEAPAGSGDYVLKIVGRDANLAARLAAGAPLEVRVEIARDGVGECFETSLPACRAAAAKDICTP